MIFTNSVQSATNPVWQKNNKIGEGWLATASFNEQTAISYVRTSCQLLAPLLAVAPFGASDTTPATSRFQTSRSFFLAALDAGLCRGARSSPPEPRPEHRPAQQVALAEVPRRNRLVHLGPARCRPFHCLPAGAGGHRNQRCIDRSHHRIRPP